MDRAAWSFICGRLVAQEDRLLGRSDFIGVLRAGSSEERQTRLRASLLFAEGPPPADAAEAVEAALVRRAREIGALSPDERIADLVLLEREWDAFREAAKKAMLSENSGTAVPGRDDEGGLFAASLSDANTDERAAVFRPAAETIRTRLPREGDRAGWIDGIVDGYAMASLVAAAEQLGSRELASWARTRALLVAALSLIRARRLAWPADELHEAWSVAGLDEPSLADVARGDESGWPAALDRLGLPYAERALGEDEPAVRLALMIDDRITELASAARGMAFGPEIVFAFLWALRAEALNLRLVLSAAEYGTPEERLVGQLRAGHG